MPALVVRQTLPNPGATDSTASKNTTEVKETKESVASPAATTLDTALFNKLNLHLANGDSSGRWPVKTAYPKPGAIFPFKRVVAYYGNLYSKNMGALGEYPTEEMLQRLTAECKKWEAADPAIPGTTRTYALYCCNCSGKSWRRVVNTVCVCHFTRSTLC